MTRRTTAWLVPALGLLLASPTAPVQAPSETLALMNALSQRFRALEQHLAEGDLTEASTTAGDLRTLLDGHLPLAPKEDPSREDVFQEQILRLDETAAELRGLAVQGDLPGAGQSLERLRASCVSCHVRFRSNNHVRGLYPARENTIRGTVELQDADGEAHPNRSWVLAFLESPPRDPAFAYAGIHPRISQSRRRFEPRVLPVIVGTVVDFPNDDTIFHNVFSLSKTAPFDLGVYEPGQSASVRMTRTGLVRVYCNIHPDMAASIVVLDNPWFALTDRTGCFVICGVPDGDYVLRAWNDMGAESRTPLPVRGGKLLETRLTLRETRRSLAHDNKQGKPYAGQYR